MSRRGFLEETTRQRVTEVIRSIEADSAVEVVVAVRKAAGRYALTSVGFGAVVATVALLVMLLSPTVYHFLVIPLDTALAFMLAAGLCASMPGLRKALTPRRRIERAVTRGAARAFEDLGIDKTRDRTGLLIYVALLERRVVVLTDSGIDTVVLGEGYAVALHKLQRAVARFDEEAFLDALSLLKRPLAEALPRQPNDINELSDHVA
jgi:putative membrane protein